MTYTTPSIVGTHQLEAQLFDEIYSTKRDTDSCSNC